MTWSELYQKLEDRCSRPEHAMNIIGHLMDDYECWDWDEEAPDGAVGILYE